MLGELERERLLVNGRNLPRMCHEKLTETILLAPTFQRLHAVFRLNRPSIVPSETLAQRERVLHTVRRHSGLIDHLRFNPQVLVRGEEGVVNKITVIARDVGRRPDRIEDFQIGMCHETEVLALLSVDRGCTQRYSGCRAMDDLSATDTVHPQFLLTVAVPQAADDPCKEPIAHSGHACPGPKSGPS